MKYVSVAEMIAIEREADASGLTYELMMEHAGRGLAETVMLVYEKHKSSGALGLIGSGNNGGDTLVALAMLAQAGWPTAAYIVRPRPQDDPLAVRFLSAGGRLLRVEDDADYTQLGAVVDQYAVLLDGVLGTGVKLPLRGKLGAVLAKVRSLVTNRPEVHVVAVDCPSGVDCDSGDAAPECIPAELTVTMAAYKQGLLSFPAYKLCGRLLLVGIGLGEDRPYPAAWEKLTRFVPDATWVAAHLPERPVDAHKGTFGTTLVIAGSANYSGAALLAGEAAYRIGTGLVTVGLPASLQPALVGCLPEATWLPLPEREGAIAEQAAEVVLSSIERVTALLFGPGFGLQATTQGFVRRLLPPANTAANNLPPLVIDADGLKLLAGLENWWQRLPGQAILTPHPGEMAVLTGRAIDEIQAGRIKIAEENARFWGHTVVLKGAFTVIADPDGRTAVNPVASPALARAGTGDVLAGLIAGLRSQGLDPFTAAVAGVWIHAQAGLQAAQDLGSTAAVLAGDVLASVPETLALLNAT